MDLNVEQTPRNQLPPLPFQYLRVANQEEAQIYTYFLRGQTPKTEAEVIEKVRKEKERKEWFTDESWREKGTPLEQVELTIGEQPLTIYNWNKPVTDEQIARITQTLATLYSKFPQLEGKLRWILIDNILDIKNASGETQNGNCMPKQRAFRLLPRGMELFPHRVAVATNLEGTLVHEIIHLLEPELLEEWNKEFGWVDCGDLPGWEVKETTVGNRFVNTNTGEISPTGYYAEDPEQCVTPYARQSVGEDIAESGVAYIFDPESLTRISPKKLSILERHTQHNPFPQTSYQKVGSDQIKLPEVKPEVVTYFIKEQQAA